MSSIKRIYTLKDFVFDLPEEQVAMYPVEKREDAKLLVLNRQTGEVRHSVFGGLPEYIKAGDVLVFNNARVVKSRLYCRRQTGGIVEFVLTRRLGENKFLAVSNRTKRLKAGELLTPDKSANTDLRFTVEGRREDYIELAANSPVSDELLDEIGCMPLPPYIKREAEAKDDERYQTVYASINGAAAAPTAGLHFSEELLSALKQFNIELQFLTLYVSWGTFTPVREQDLSRHKMHSEKYELPESVAAVVNEARNTGRRIIAVGTTSLRVLEATFNGSENIAGAGETSIFIKPPMEVKSVQGLITNFHTPASTLLMLVAAFAGYDLTMRTYSEAVKNKYRFFSYGDAMLII